jgi:autotransporter-associated beta strand protein
MKAIGNTHRRTYYLLTVLAIAALAAPYAWADKYKADNTVPLNQAASWVENAVPNSSEFGVWDSTVTAPMTSSLGANMTWGGIKILDPGGPIWLATGNTLTLVSVAGTGIDLSSATQDFTVNCRLSMPANQVWVVAADRTLVVNNVVSGPGGLRKADAGLLVLNATNSYTGSTVVSNGTLFVNGVLATASSVNVLAGATLGGNGIIRGPVTLQADATLAPGVGGIGTLTVSNHLTLSGTTVMDVNKSLGVWQNDLVAGVSNLTYGGVLTVVATGDALVPGDTLKLFDAQHYAGSFSAIVPPTPGPGWTWDTSALTVDGTLRVMMSYTITIPAGACSLIANQLDNPGGNTLANLIPSLPCEAYLMKFDNGSYSWITNDYLPALGWANPTITLNPGEGAFLCSCCATNFEITFTGLPRAEVAVNIPNGRCYLLSRQVPAPGTYDTITGFAPVGGAMAYTWNGVYTAYYFDPDDLTWYPSAPTTPIGGAMWISPSGAPVPTMPDVLCPTNCTEPLILTCATNKTVQCPASWSFDLPVVSDFCCGTNYTLTNSTVTNFSSPCSNSYTRTWQVTDCSNRTATCSQTVSVVATTPPVMTCASNKTVNCSTNWSFDPPTALDTCFGTNVAVSVQSTVTNGLCPRLATRVWLAYNACSNASTTCTQVVTITNTAPPVMSCSSNKAVNCGTAWSFDPPTALDTCLGTNVPVSIQSTVTNGLCPPVVTRIWIAYNACSNNSATCTQVVTVVNNLPPVMGCASNKTVNCTTNWSFDPPTAFDACAGTNVTVNILSTATNGLCPRLATRTWIAYNACSNFFGT